MWLADRQRKRFECVLNVWQKECLLNCLPYNQEPVPTSVILVEIIFWRSIVFPYCPIWSWVRPPSICSEKSHACTCASILRPLTWSGACTTALSSNCREVSTRPLRIFSVESGGGTSKLGHYYNEEKTACRGMCARGEGGAFPCPNPAVCGKYLRKYILSLPDVATWRKLSHCVMERHHKDIDLQVFTGLSRVSWGK